MSNNKSTGGYIVRHKGCGKSTNVAPKAAASTLEPMGMRQLFDAATCTYSYLLWDKETEDAIIIDPVGEEVS